MICQYSASRDIKFPDQRQYMKQGDLLMYNDVTSAMTVYRNSNLIGTVRFSKSALEEFKHLGWITHPTELNAVEGSKLPIVQGIDVGFEDSKSVLVTAEIDSDDSLHIISIDEVGPEELPEEAVTKKSRKTKKS